MAIEWYNNEAPEESIEVESGSSSYVPDEANTDIYNYQSKNLLALVDPSFESTWRSSWRATGTNASTLNEYGFQSSTHVIDGEYAGGVFADGTPVTSAYSLRTSTAGVDTPATLTDMVAASDTYTMSFYAWANTFVTSLTVRVVPYISGVAQTDAYNLPVSVSNTLQKKTISFTLPANTDSVFISFTTPSVTTGAYVYVFTIDALQLEAGNSATDFEANGAFTEILSSDTYKIRIGNSTTDESYFHVHSDGTTYASRFRLNAGEVSLDSTSHGFQIGDSSGLNIRMDSNEFQGVDNGAPSVIRINTNGGNVRMGNTDSNIYIGDGTNSTDHGAVASSAIYYDSTGTAGSAVHTYATSHLLRRYTSTYHIKDNISPLSELTTLSVLVPEEKITGTISFNPKDILTITPVAYNPIGSGDNPNKIEIGFIAEDIADKIPDLAVLNEEGNPEFYNIYGVVASMLAVIQEQEAKIISMEQRLAILEN